MIIKARVNRLSAKDEYEDVYINKSYIVSVERYECHAIIRLTNDMSYITEKCFDEVMKLIKQQNDCVVDQNPEHQR